MSLRQLGERVGVSKATIAQMENREPEGAITLSSMQKVAEAMDSDLYYVVLPRRGLDETLRRRAHGLARELAREVAHSMQLEDQATSGDRLEELIEYHAARFLQEPGSLWDDV